jgi:hypothetical protein
LISLAIGEAASVMQSRSHAVTISLVTAMRNPGLALLLATQFADPVRGLRLAILLYVVLAVLVSGFLVKTKGLMMCWRRPADRGREHPLRSAFCQLRLELTGATDYPAICRFIKAARTTWPWTAEPRFSC